MKNLFKTLLPIIMFSNIYHVEAAEWNHNNGIENNLEIHNTQQNTILDIINQIGHHAALSYLGGQSNETINMYNQYQNEGNAENSAEYITELRNAILHRSNNLLSQIFAYIDYVKLIGQNMCVVQANALSDTIFTSVNLPIYLNCLQY